MSLLAETVTPLKETHGLLASAIGVERAYESTGRRIGFAPRTLNDNGYQNRQEIISFQRVLI